MKSINQYLSEKLIVNNTIQNSELTELTDEETKIVSKLMYIFTTYNCTYDILEELNKYKNHPEKITDDQWYYLINILISSIYMPSKDEIKSMSSVLSNEEYKWIDNKLKADWNDIMKAGGHASKEEVLIKSENYRRGMLQGAIQSFDDYH